MLKYKGLNVAILTQGWTIGLWRDREYRSGCRSSDLTMQPGWRRKLTGDMAKLFHEQHESDVENIARCQMIPLLIYSNLKNGASESYSTASTFKAVFLLFPLPGERKVCICMCIDFVYVYLCQGYYNNWRTECHIW